MVHIIYRKLGFLVFVFAFGFAFVGELASDYFSGDKNYWDNNRWVLGLALVAAGTASWFLGKFLEPNKVIIDKKATAPLLLKQTRSKFSITGEHSLFFIGMQYWGPILWAIGIVVILASLT